MSISLDIRDGLPFVSVILEANHQTIVIEDVLIDTGSSDCIFRTDDLLSIGVIPVMSDQILVMMGVGGDEQVITKQIDSITIGHLRLSPCLIQMGEVNYGYRLNGIIGFKFLQETGAIINAKRLTIE